MGQWMVWLATRTVSGGGTVDPRAPETGLFGAASSALPVIMHLAKTIAFVSCWFFTSFNRAVLLLYRLEFI